MELLGGLTREEQEAMNSELWKLKMHINGGHSTTPQGKPTRAVPGRADERRCKDSRDRLFSRRVLANYEAKNFQYKLAMGLHASLSTVQTVKTH